MSDPGPEVYTGHVNSTEFYKYHRLLVKSLAGNGGEIYINELELYGHEEGSGSLDTTLKSVYNVPATTGTQLEVYYDAKDLTTMPGTVTDLSPQSRDSTATNVTIDSTWNAFRFSGSGSETKIENFTISGEDYVHSISLWFNSDEDYTDITSPDSRKIFFLGADVTSGSAATSGVSALSFSAHDNSGEGYLRWYHWGNDTNYDIKLRKNEWYHVTLVYKGGTSDTQEVYVNNKFIEPINGGSSSDPIDLPTTIDLFLGRGRTASRNAFKGMIANFRLYSKALNAGQVQELYDYQKDYFLGSKSQVTLYKGHLGVGVTEPSGQLELAGDARIQEYPPRGMTDFDTHIEGHGVFTASASSQYSDTFEPWGAFSDTSDYDLDIWVSGGTDWSSTDGTPAVLYYLADNTPGGAWLKIEMPYKIKLNSFSFVTGTRSYSTESFPENFQIWASNNGTEWNQIYSVSGFGNPPNETGGTTWGHTNVNSQTHYSMYAMVITKLYMIGTETRTFASIPRWQLFGTPGPTTLDKGSLTLGRSLDVPRISRYDVDTETPRPEKLVVDFDTTVNSSPTDISGKGNHGAFYGSASYSAADKAFDFGTAGDSISTSITNGQGAYVHSVSIWFKVDALANVLWHLGTDGGSSGSDTSSIYFDSSGTHWFFWSNDVIFGTAVTIGSWNHMVCVYNGGTASTSRRLWLNGIERTITSTSGGQINQALSIEANTTLRLASRPANTTVCDCKISNFKLYSVALEPSEVQKLYRLGRTGRSMVISDTAVGIGKVPEAQLDVRGSLRCDVVSDFLKIDHAGNQLSIGSSDVYQNEFRWYTWSSGCNWFTPYTGQSIYIGRDGETLDEFNFYNVTTVKRGSSVISSSDDRLKRDEAFIINATDSILKLKPQTYIKKHRLPENENDTNIPEQFEAGLIAQDVWYDAPELRFLVHPSEDANPSETKPISPDPNDPTQDPDYSSWGTTQAYVNYEGFLPYLIKSNQEIYTELQAEKVRNDTLETQLASLLVRLDTLESA